ncbi:DUF3048 domain-containing protein, partial [Candidatus Roizmanbacteria bacterium]|nr:DUF3048 domain-containing protein [Candidatus Roizmanbacteria bacterium]
TYYFLSSGQAASVFPSLSQYSPPKTNGSLTNGKGKENEAKNQECPLNGEMLTNSQKQKWLKRRPLGVAIENHEEARPQSGLTSADIVYEAVAEGGITRFLAIFYCKDASYIGPVRSARIYFIKLLEEYGQNPLYAHVGGANTPGPADALGEIKNLGWGNYNDLNQFAVPFPYYWRDYERLPGRITEHTVYSATNKLWEFAKNKRKLTNVDDDGKKWDGSFTAWKFKNDAPASGRGDTTSISFGFWDLFAANYSVNWVYNKAENSYKRENGGADHIDKNTGKPLKAKNVVVVFAQESPANDGYPGGHLLYKLTGAGEGLLFQDGKASEISWSKKNGESRMKFVDVTGKEASFVRGQIFVEMLPIGNKVTY